MSCLAEILNLFFELIGTMIVVVVVVVDLLFFYFGNFFFGVSVDETGSDDCAMFTNKFLTNVF